MSRLGLIVEGHGEVAAVPTLIRRLVADLGAAFVEMPHPFRLQKGRLIKENELKRAVDLMARKTDPDGAVLVLVDGDDDCPAELGPRLNLWAKEARRDRRVAVVVAFPEFETWYVAAAKSLRGCRGLPPDLAPPQEPEAIRGAKEWLGHHMPQGYTETVDQAPLAVSFDWRAAAAGTRSFPRFLRALSALVDVGPA